MAAVRKHLGFSHCDYLPASSGASRYTHSQANVSIKRATWIRVKAEGELRPGMTVELRPCGFCGRRERLILLRVGDKQLSLHHSGDMLPGHGRGWFAAPGLCLNPRRPVDLSVAISTGRLWRLGDEDLEESTFETAQEVVSANRIGRR